MKRLSIFFLLAAVILSCSNSTGTEPEANLIQIGTWSVNPDEMTGTWTGKASKANDTMQGKGDTLYFEEPLKSQDIRIVGWPHEKLFSLFYMDRNIISETFTADDALNNSSYTIQTPFEDSLYSNIPL